MAFTQENYSEFINKLSQMSEEKYKQFNENIVPGIVKSFGIRVPVLREAAKEIMKGDFRGFLACKMGEYYDEYMVRAMVISGAKMPIDERLKYIEAFVPYINNWAVCDTLCNDFKDARKHRGEVWDFLQPYFNSTNEFYLRFGAVMLLWHFTTDEYAVKSLDILKNIHHEGYYTKMGVAWAVSQFFVYQRSLTMPYLEKQVFEAWTQNKAIQKIRESYRVTKEDKEYLWAYRLPLKK